MLSPLSMRLFLGGALASALLLLFLLGPSSERPQDALAGDTVPGRYIVVLRDGLNPSGYAAVLGRRHGFAADLVYRRALRGFAASLSGRAAMALRNDPNVLLVEPDRAVILYDLPTGIDRIDADVLLSGGDPAPDTDIAIIDTGVDVDHPDLRVAGGVRFVDSDSPCGDADGSGSYDDDHGHGTHVAGIAAGRDNGSSVVGVAAGARIWSVKVLNAFGGGSMSCVIRGVDWVTAHADMIDVANISLGFYSSAALCNAIASSVAAGVVYVVAAGNLSSDAGSYSPSNCSDVITVSAIADSDGMPGGLGPPTGYGPDDSFATFSNRGSAVDIAAPGVGIVSAYPGGGYAIGSGTSTASPHVAGAVALYMLTSGYTGSAHGPDVVTAMIDDGWTVAQSSACGFTGDTDGDPEPLVYLGTDCADEPDSNPVPTSTATPTPTPTATPTPTPTPVPTPTPTPTPPPPPDDYDGDGVPDSADNCPAWPNADQSLPPWPVPADDPDCDGFASATEEAVGTDPMIHCATTGAPNDEETEFWPPDANDDQDADVVDVLTLFNWKVLYEPAYTPRSDFDADGDIDVVDIVTWMAGQMGTCA